MPITGAGASITVDGVVPSGGRLVSAGNKTFALGNNYSGGLEYEWSISTSADIGNLELSSYTSPTTTLRTKDGMPIRKSGSVTISLTVRTRRVVSIAVLFGGNFYVVGDAATITTNDSTGMSAAAEVATIDSTSMLGGAVGPYNPPKDAILTVTVTNQGYDYSVNPSVTFPTGAGNAIAGEVTMETMTYTSTVELIIGAKNYSFYYKTCSDDAALDSQIKEFLGSQQDAIKDVEYLLESVSTDVSSLEDLVGSVDPLYDQADNCTATNCRFSEPTSRDEREENLYNAKKVLVVDGRLLRPYGTDLVGFVRLHELVYGSNAQFLPAAGMDVIRNVLSLGSGALLAISWKYGNVSDSCSTAGKVALQHAVWTPSMAHFTVYGSNNTVASSISQLASLYGIDEEAVFTTIFWVEEIGVMGGSYSSLSKLGFTDEQLINVLTGKEDAQPSTYVIKSSHLTALANYDLDDSYVTKILLRGVTGIDTTLDDAGILEYANKLLSTVPSQDNCGISIEDLSNLLFDTLDFGKSFTNKPAEALNSCISSISDGSLNAVLSAISDSVSAANSVVSLVQDYIGDTVTKVQGLESQLWSLVNPDAGFGSNILNCMLGDHIYLPVNVALIEGLLDSIPGVHLLIKSLFDPIFAVLDSLSNPLCATADITDQVLALFGVGTNPAITCLTSFGLEVDVDQILADYPCLLTALSDIRAAMNFFISLLQTINFAAKSFLALLDALFSGVDIRFNKSIYCGSESTRVTDIVSTLGGLLTATPVAA